MNLFKVNSIKDVLIHLAIIVAIVITLLVLFFYVYLPSATNHGETVTIPDLEGIHLDDIDEFLTKRNLRYEVLTDSGYTAEYEPLTILNQHPVPGAKVKESRKVFLTLNAINPPQVKMPDLVDGSVKNAQLVLQSYGLERGNIKYVADLAQNAVLEQNYEGKPIEAGTYIPKGSKIDLVVGDGLGNTVLEVPDINGMDLEEAEFIVVGSGLKVGSILFQDPQYAGKDAREVLKNATPGERFVVVKQNPASERNVRIGVEVDIWLKLQDGNQDSILDEEEEEETTDLSETE
ncbi:PASTA domain-containing protein [Catalinimonas niigatensis]|uniref:PASTA domain-containing protein n=1 Tax=Catalinimonas niigatensis TaxID=1397264 RepID=UPI0026657B23|nr:PASTA domain-containing protein [Catalinimonas niigatensis]WPP51408.1 PASTA domain-containing protein [Catalinimonas niigatensis]